MWFLALRRNVQPRNEWTVRLDQHLAWMQQQHLAGTIVISGPTPDHSDPFTAAGHCAFELIEWEVHQILGAGPFAEDAQRVMQAAQVPHQ